MSRSSHLSVGSSITISVVSPTPPTLSQEDLTLPTPTQSSVPSPTQERPDSLRQAPDHTTLNNTNGLNDFSQINSKSFRITADANSHDRTDSEAGLAASAPDFTVGHIESANNAPWTGLGEAVTPEQGLARRTSDPDPKVTRDNFQDADRNSEYGREGDRLRLQPVHRKKSVSSIDLNSVQGTRYWNLVRDNFVDNHLEVGVTPGSNRLRLGANPSNKGTKGFGRKLSLADITGHLLSASIGYLHKIGQRSHRNSLQPGSGATMELLRLRKGSLTSVGAFGGVGEISNLN